MICPVCGDVIYEGAAFCGRCGSMAADLGEAKPDATPQRRSSPWLRILAGALTASAVVLILASLSAGPSRGPGVRSVPNVVGRSCAAAEARLAKAGFECAIGQGELSSSTEVGAVIRQLPESGTPTSTHKVTIVPSLGPGVMVPDVVGKPQKTALAALAEHSLAGAVAKSEPSTSLAAGLVARSWPSAGMWAPEGTAVRLAVSTGPGSRSAAAAVARIPDVTGKSGSQAKRLLRSAGLSYAVSRKRFSTAVPHGYVISQSPGPGGATPTDKKVRVALSLGRGVRMPDVMGKSEQDASKLLKGIGLRVAASHRQAEAQKGRVISSSPRAGVTVAAGSSVKLGISSGPAYGVVTVEAEPSDWEVWLYVDGGGARGKCPITIRLPAGEHSLVLWEPSQQKRLSAPVTVEPGQTVTIRKDLARESA